ncbi:hypothetical protein EX895_005167 [Sporisorium graminicola]|uniref:U6 snRNA phosphodiesterase 1 n=1 Tax=Sporisorium graminicola TaxID=280036 RepID=A0A4U7KR14_9BASI|nr:hypothetical protein EX895_005167 [Sporisorium graminicola]TKY85628.1 hypothetical protein EX895_005167 [Sporisorium graminicola]
MQPPATCSGASINDHAGQGSLETEMKAAAPRRPKRKLPPLDLEADTLQQDDDKMPYRSSSRVRANPSGASKVVKGDWLCYCFVEVPVDPSLSKCIQEGIAKLQEQLVSDYTLLDLRCNDNAADSETTATADESQAFEQQLHISLTRPFTVRSYEREEYIKVATAEAERLKATVGSFPFAFSRFAYLANDDASRHFMVLEVGPGREKLHRLSTAFSTELRRAFRAKSYYDEARFHASTACVLDPSSERGDEGGTQTLSSRLSQVIADVEAKFGPQLRQCRQVWAARIGIQVANRVTYVDV